MGSNRSKRSSRSNRRIVRGADVPITVVETLFDIVVAEDLREILQKPFSYSGEIRLAAQLFRHRSHVGPGETAGNDALEVNKIGIHVQRQAVKGNAAAHGDADGGDFLIG